MLYLNVFRIGGGNLMQAILFLSWLILVFVWGYVQIRYAQNGFPNSPTWLLLRYGLGFFQGVVITIFLLSYTNKGLVLIVNWSLIGGIFSAFAAYLFQFNLRHLFPESASHDGKDDMLEL